MKECICKSYLNARCPLHRDKERPNQGKSYYEYLQEEEKINGWKRKVAMEHAVMAMEERKRLGINISIPGVNPKTFK